MLRTGISHLLLTMLCTARCGFGLSKHVKNNVLHVDDRHILHPLGKHIANYDCSTSEVRPVLVQSLASHQAVKGSSHPSAYAADHIYAGW